MISDPKIDPAVANEAIAAVGQTELATIHVIAYGADAASALTDVGAADVQQLDLIVGASGTIAALQLKHARRRQSYRAGRRLTRVVD